MHLRQKAVIRAFLDSTKAAASPGEGAHEAKSELQTLTFRAGGMRIIRSSEPWGLTQAGSFETLSIALRLRPQTDWAILSPMSVKARIDWIRL